MTGRLEGARWCSIATASGGYGGSLRTNDNGLFIVFSTDAGLHTGKHGKPDIRGLFLTDVEIRHAPSGYQGTRLGANQK